MPEDDPKLVLYKLEYETAAARYHQIYQSVWTIFSYLSAIAAALLAFGGEHIEAGAVVMFACLPLIFWFWSTYLPLDRYGNWTLERLADIEQTLNRNWGVELKHFTMFQHRRKSNGATLLPTVVAADKQPPAAPKAVDEQPPAESAKQDPKAWHFYIKRTRFAIWVFAIILHVAFVLGLCVTVLQLLRGEQILHSREATTPTPPIAIYHEINNVAPPAHTERDSVGAPVAPKSSKQQGHQ